VFLFFALVFLPLVYAACFHFTRETSYPDFLGFDIARAVLRFHVPAAFIALLLSGISVIRRERLRRLSWVVLILSALWFAFSLIAGLMFHA
jgi:hypothetical protein